MQKNIQEKQYIHFKGSVPVKYEIGLLKTLINIAEKTLDAEPNNSKEDLSSDGYPDYFINKYFK